VPDYNFILHFQLPKADDDPEAYLDALFEAGCDDATVGVGILGAIALDFCREADDAATAVRTAFEDVLKAIPEATLTEVGPDLLNTSEIADVISERAQKITRQAMRKYAQNQIAHMKTRFPCAAITSRSPLWHFDEVLNWMVDNEKLMAEIAHPLIETSKTVRAINSVLQREDAPEELVIMAEEMIACQAGVMHLS